MISNDEIMDIFSRFQNLNLLTLIGNLKEKRVASGHFIDDDQSPPWMCPLQHGFKSSSCPYPSKQLGISCNLFNRFWESWDEADCISDRRFSQILSDIWCQRLADADAVQQVITNEVKEPKDECIPHQVHS